MVFGKAKSPVITTSGVEIGGGAVLPEVNFTLPLMSIAENTMPEVQKKYRDITTRVLERAVTLHQEALVLEFEQLYELTIEPDWGAQITEDMKVIMEQFRSKYGVRSALRVTVADIRDKDRPPLMRGGKPLELMIRAFDLCASAGADILSIESTGGKEITDKALMFGDIGGLAYGLGVLAHRDMSFLWGKIVEIAARHGVIAGGDTACGFANTAMQLAHQKLLPGVFAAVVRLMAAPRSLVAVEIGAIGPLKDCGYENPIIKAITGVPISMEGKTSACAHSSVLGNIAAAVCDLWSNESVHDVRLLSGYTPEIFAEMLIYDCRLMNTALKTDKAVALQDLFIQSDRYLDSQALVMDPEVMFETARRIVEAGPDGYSRTLAATRQALDAILGALANDSMTLPKNEERWLKKLETGIHALPADPEELFANLNPEYRDLFIPAEYGIVVK